jgi:hypothetical protein
MTGGVSFFDLQHHHPKHSLFFPMADPPRLPTGLAILKAFRASLRLVTSSSELLTVSQLLAVRNELLDMFAVVNTRLHVVQFGPFAENLLYGTLELTHIS